MPTILLEIDPSDGSLIKTYIHANAQILAQHTGDHTAGRYFYLHDGLGSVRLIMDSSAVVAQDYTYEPFGEVIDSGGSFGNSFMLQQSESPPPAWFIAQYFDSEIEEYYLRARQPGRVGCAHH